jgi:hypothetical protein
MNKTEVGIKKIRGIPRKHETIGEENLSVKENRESREQKNSAYTRPVLARRRFHRLGFNRKKLQRSS